MKITLLHPSRGRANKARETFDYWISKSSGNIEIDHFVAIDEDDKQKYDYYRAFESSKKSIIICAETSDVVSATNGIAKIAGGDILVYLSDDFKCPDLWDTKIVDAFRQRNIINPAPVLLKVDDCLQPFHVAVLTIPIMNKQLYDKLGYFWHPGYKSMFVDEDLYWTCNNNGWLVFAPDLYFPHEHAANGKAPNDETYKRSAANWEQGKAFFAERKTLNFPL